MSAHLERDIDQWVVAACRKRGWLCRKLSTVGFRGTSGDPDRQIVLPGGRHYYLEIKTLTGRLTKKQEHRITQLAVLGCHITVVYGMADAQAYIRELDDELTG